MIADAIMFVVGKLLEFASVITTGVAAMFFALFSLFLGEQNTSQIADILAAVNQWVPLDFFCACLAAVVTIFSTNYIIKRIFDVIP